LIRRALIALVLSVSKPVAAQLPSLPPEIAAEVTREARYPAREATFPHGVKGIRDVIFWSPVGYRPLTLDLYLLPSTAKRPAAGFPPVVQIHGGGWMVGDTHHSGLSLIFSGFSLRWRPKTTSLLRSSIA
jgi:acetyl esterase/lipase